MPFSTSLKSLKPLKVTTLAFYFLVCWIGLFFVFYPTLLSGFTKTQGELLDTRLTNYFLEHSFKLLTNKNYIGEIWSPPFFYPYEGALAFSENLFGSSPIYWLFRTFFGVDLAFQIWALTVLGLCFFSFVLLMRQHQVSHLLSALGGFLFAFGIPRIAQLGHPQLLPQFFTPVTLIAVWNFCRKPSNKSLILLLLLIYLQVLSGIYLGWFLLFSLCFFVGLLYLFNRDARDRAAAYLRQSLKSCIAIITTWTALLVILLLPYLETKQTLGGRSYAEVDSLLPRLSSWFSPVPNSLWWPVFSKLSANIPMAHEHHIFMGFLVIFLLGLSIYVLLIRRNLLSSDKLIFAEICLATALIVFVISLRLPNGWSLWRYIYELVPGATAIRGVSRIWCIFYFYVLAASIVCCDSLLKQIPKRRFRLAILTVITVFGLSEQMVFSMPSYEKLPLLQERAEMQETLKGCDFAYFSADPYKPFDVVQFHTMQVSTMMASLAVNVPLINGYTASYPPGYPSYGKSGLQGSFSIYEIVHWLGEKKQGKLCLISPKNPNKQNDFLIANSPELASRSKIEASQNFVRFTLKLPLPQVFYQ